VERSDTHQLHFMKMMWTHLRSDASTPSIWLGNAITMELAASLLSVKLRRAPPSSN
jgi:hypothetical protein